MMCHRIARLILFLGIPGVLAQDQWCGKNYRAGQRAVDPGGRYVVPPVLAIPRLNFRCWPLIQPYIQGEDTNANVLVDLFTTDRSIVGSQEVRQPDRGTAGSWSVSIIARLNNRDTTLVTGNVQFNTTGNLTFALRNLPPQFNFYNLTCRVYPAGRTANTYTTTFALTHLPPPTGGGSITKTDYRNGALLVKSRDSNQYKPVLPFGFYTNFDDYLALNLSIVDRAAAGGRNMIHAVPNFTNFTALQRVVERMAEKEVWLMFDMRHVYMNNTAVEQQVSILRDYPYLLLWYTADEPDGSQDPRNATNVAGATLNRLDPYHPVSLVLNCQDYYFDDYSKGASVILQDTYTIEINSTYSRVWNTPCNTTLGDCGCDNCKGSMKDVADRIETYRQRLFWSGRYRGTSIWSVPQAFGEETYWPRYPTLKEFVAQIVLALNHGSLGIVPWNEFKGTPPRILEGADQIGRALLTMSNFLLSADNTVRLKTIRDGDVDIAVWTLDFVYGGNIMLILATNYGAARQVPVFLSPGRPDGPLYQGAQVVADLEPGWTMEDLVELMQRRRPEKKLSKRVVIEVLNTGVDFSVQNGSYVSLDMEEMGSIGVLL